MGGVICAAVDEAGDVGEFEVLRDGVVGTASCGATESDGASCARLGGERLHSKTSTKVQQRIDRPRSIELDRILDISVCIPIVEQYCC